MNENFWDGFEKQAGVLKDVGRSVKSTAIKGQRAVKRLGERLRDYAEHEMSGRSRIVSNHPGFKARSLNNAGLTSMNSKYNKAVDKEHMGMYGHRWSNPKIDKR